MLRPCFIWRSHTYQHCDFLLGPLQLIYLHCSIWNSLLMQHSRSTLAFKPHFPLPPTWYLLTLHPYHHLMFMAVFLYLLLPLPPDYLRVLQWNAWSLRPKSTKLSTVYLVLSVDLICIQKSHYNSPSSFRTFEFSARRSDRIYFRSDILSPEDMHASCGVIIFATQGLSSFELSTSSLPLLDPYFDYVGVNISLNNSSSLSFLNVYALPIRSSSTDGKTDSSSFILSSSRNLFILEHFNYYHPSGAQEVLPTPPWGGSIRLGHLL